MTQDVNVVCRPTPEGFRCDVVVGTDEAATRHAVTVAEDDLARLAPGHDDPDEFVRASFDFLLAQEPRESILSSFELPVIERYFPGYAAEMGRRMAR